MDFGSKSRIVNCMPVVPFNPIEPINKNPQKQWDFAYVWESNYDDYVIRFQTMDIEENDAILIRFNFDYKPHFKLKEFEAFNLDKKKNVTTLIDINNLKDTLEQFIKDMKEAEQEETHGFRKLF